MAFLSETDLLHLIELQATNLRQSLDVYRAVYAPVDPEEKKFVTRSIDDVGDILAWSSTQAFIAAKNEKANEKAEEK